MSKLGYNKDYAGQMFGSLTVIEFDCRKGSHTYWIFECECGNRISRTVKNIAKNTINACPDCKRGSKSHAWQGSTHVPMSLWTAAKHSAAEKGIAFTMTIDDLEAQWVKQDGKCAYTGHELTFGKVYADASRTASIDRIDSTKGYTSDNIQWARKDINWLKKNKPDQDFIQMCKDVARYRNNHD